MRVKDKLLIYRNVGLRPIAATGMLWNHRHTLKYLWRKKRYRSFWNHIFVTYFVRGEDCGKGILDPLWKLTGKAPFLWDLELEITTRCYLKCIMCEHTYWKDKSYLNQDLKFEDFKILIDGIPNLRWINLTGEGSSFLNPDFMKIVQYSKQEGLYVDFSHDFFRITEEEMRRLIEWDVDRIYWSFDGCSKNTFEKIRVGAEFEEVVGNVQKFLWLKKEVGSPLPEICFRFCFFKDNIHEVEHIPEFLSHVADGDVSKYGDEPSINIVALLEFEETKNWAVEVSPLTVDYVNERAEALGFKVYWSHITHIEDNKVPLEYCTFWSEPYIMITGHVVPCCAVMMSNNRTQLEELAFGNIHEQSLKEIWNSERYKAFRRMVVNPKASVPQVCAGCRAFNTLDRVREYGLS